MIQDRELKIDHVYWAEIIDESLQEFGKQIQARFTGIYFRDIAVKQKIISEPRSTKFRNNYKKAGEYLLCEIKIYREVKPEELFVK